MKARIFFISLLVLPLACVFAQAQNYNGDARKIGMGGSGYSGNIASEMIEEERSYSSVSVPLGLIQLFRDIDRFNPDDKGDFDPVLALEYAANPLHVVVGRDSGGSRGRFISNMINGDLSRDLNDYPSFKLTNHLKAEGLTSPSWGKTIKFLGHSDGSFQGVYVGLGPYISAATDLNIDKSLTDVLAKATPVAPDSNYRITDRSDGQLAMAVTAGYRARFSLPGETSSSRDGIYVGMNYHYLRGFAYADSNIDVRMGTDSEGLLTLNQTTVPLTIDYLSSHSGTGFALDFGVGAVVQGWELGFGINGVGNRIKWHDLALKEFQLNSLVDGGDFEEQALPVPSSDLTVKLPVRYTWNAGYNYGRYHFVSELAHGFEGTRFDGGVEYRLGLVELRGGGRYGLDRWHPSGGIGLNFGKISLDGSIFGTTTNIARDLQPALALSVRLNHGKKE